MRILGRISIFFAMVVSVAFAATAQQSVPDTKLMGLRGKVKSLVASTKAVSGYAEWVLKNEQKDQTTYQFDQMGNLTEALFEGAVSSKSVYSLVDGFKTFKIIELEAPDTKRPRFTVRGSIEREQVEPGIRPTDPDQRFDFKYVYEITPGGALVIERQYTNTGEVFKKRTFKYEKTGVLIYEKQEDSVAVMTFVFKYDDKGNVVEVMETRDIRGPGSDSKERITFTEIKFDAVGNWTQRKSTRHVETDAMPQYNVQAKKFTLVDMEYRVFTYH